MLRQLCTGKGEEKVPVADVVALVAGRSLVSAGFSTVMLASPEMLLEINGGDHARAERVRAAVETATTLAAFLARPTIGALIDSHGRLGALVLGPLASAVARALLVWRPSNATYIAYRVANMLSLIPLMQAFTAALADRLGGRGSDQYVRVSKAAYMWLALVRMATLRLTRRVKSPRAAFKLGAALNVGASAVFALTVRESLPESERRPFKLRQAANPFSFVWFFSQSRQLMALAALTLCTAAPSYNGAEGFYRRKRFGWGRAENERMQQLDNFLEVVSPLYSVPIMERLGRQQTAALSHLVRALCNLNVAFSTRGATLALNPVARSIFDGAALEGLVERAAASTGAGQGQISAMNMNLRFPLGLVLPSFFSDLFARSMEWEGWRGAAPFLVCSALEALNGAVIVPMAWHAMQP